jgi:enoyl-[acyl-carrier-protein] reductase (NADH)
VNEINKNGGQAVGISTDVADGESVKKALAQLKEQMGSSKLSAAIYNVGGKFIRKPFLELSASEFESGWEANGYGLDTRG